MEEIEKRVSGVWGVPGQPDRTRRAQVASQATQIGVCSQEAFGPLFEVLLKSKLIVNYTS